MGVLLPKENAMTCKLTATLIASAAALSLAACGRDTTDTYDNLVPEEESPLDTPATAAPNADGTIPVSMQGRWGLEQGDCVAAAGTGTGLLTITPDRLEFHESAGTLDNVDRSGMESIRASFDFTGEGMEWRRSMELTLEDGGQALVRREYGDDAAPEPFRYVRCP